MVFFVISMPIRSADMLPALGAQRAKAGNLPALQFLP
jgi:hypothetical protein